MNRSKSLGIAQAQVEVSFKWDVIKKKRTRLMLAACSRKKRRKKKGLVLQVSIQPALEWQYLHPS